MSPMWKSNIWNECDYEQDAVRIRTAVNAGLGRVMQFLPSIAPVQLNLPSPDMIQF